MFEFPAEPGQKIIAEGDDGDNFYVIENGVYDVYKVVFLPNYFRTLEFLKFSTIFFLEYRWRRSQSRLIRQ